MSGGPYIFERLLQVLLADGLARDRLTVRQVLELIIPFKYEKTHLCATLLLAPKRNGHTKSYLHEA